MLHGASRGLRKVHTLTEAGIQNVTKVLNKSFGGLSLGGWMDGFSVTLGGVSTL